MAWLPKKRVVVPFDFSEPSARSLDCARTFVAKLEDLQIVHVLPTIEIAEPGVIWDTIDNDTRRHHAQTAFENRFAGTDFSKATLHVCFGDPAREIGRFAEENGADLIVMPSHGRTGITRLLIGSVAERVVRLAHCPVLILK